MQELIPLHLVMPVMYSRSVDVLARAGAETWVEVGGRKALTGLARSITAASLLPQPRLLTSSLPGESELAQIEAAAKAQLSRARVEVNTRSRVHLHVPVPMHAPDRQPTASAA